MDSSERFTPGDKVVPNRNGKMAGCVRTGVVAAIKAGMVEVRYPDGDREWSRVEFWEEPGG